MSAPRVTGVLTVMVGGRPRRYLPAEPQLGMSEDGEPAWSVGFIADPEND